jgi:hypothetical protein
MGFLSVRRPTLPTLDRLTLAELRPEQVAVGISPNDQKDLLRVALAQRGLDRVVVETANKLQGLEFEVVIAWHPQAVRMTASC